MGEMTIEEALKIADNVASEAEILMYGGPLVSVLAKAVRDQTDIIRVQRECLTDSHRAYERERQRVEAAEKTLDDYIKDSSWHRGIYCLERETKLEAELSKAADFSREVHERLEKAEAQTHRYRAALEEIARALDPDTEGGPLIEYPLRVAKQAIASPRLAEGQEK